MSSFSIGQMNQLGDAFETAGFIPNDLTCFGQSGRLAEFRGVLRGTHEIVMKAASRVFSIWRTVGLGLHKTPEAYEKALEANSFMIGDHARKILKKISISQIEIELDLVVVTPAELGLKDPTYQQICDRAVQLGLEKCPRELGPALLLITWTSPTESGSV